MNKLLIIAALMFSTQANAAEIDVEMTQKEAAVAQHERMTLQEQIAADAARDPYSEDRQLNLTGEYRVDEYILPVAAREMQPSRVFELKNGNTIVRY